MRGPRVAAIQPPGSRMLGRRWVRPGVARDQVRPGAGAVHRAVVEHHALPVVAVLLLHAVHRDFFRITSQILHYIIGIPMVSKVKRRLGQDCKKELQN